MRTGICNCLAIYDWNNHISPLRFHEIAKALFDANHVSPDIGSVSNEENDLHEYADIVAALPSSHNGLDLYHTIPEYKQLVFGWDVFASLDIGQSRTMTLCFAENLANIKIDYFKDVVRVLSREVELKYGIGYQREFTLGPDMYAYGMVTGLGYSPLDMAEGDRIAAWMHERPMLNRHLEGYLRDVYSLNVLSSKHVSRLVKGVPLGRWIEQSSDHGRIAEIDSGVWLWSVADSQRARLRTELHEAGLLIAGQTLISSPAM